LLISSGAAALYTLTSGQAINDDGQILAEGYVDATGANAAFLLNPISSVPLPAAAWLLISGLGGLARLRKSRS